MCMRYLKACAILHANNYVVSLTKSFFMRQLQFAELSSHLNKIEL